MDFINSNLAKLLLSDKLECEIVRLVEQNPSAHFFFDEFPFGKNGVKMDSLTKISANIPVNNCLWIACQFQKNPQAEDLQKCGSY